MNAKFVLQREAVPDREFLWGRGKQWTSIRVPEQGEWVLRKAMPRAGSPGRVGAIRRQATGVQERSLCQPCPNLCDLLRGGQVLECRFAANAASKSLMGRFRDVWKEVKLPLFLFFFLREKKSPFFLREKKRVLWGKLVRENKPQRFSPNFGDTSWWGQPCSFTLRMLHLWNWAPGPVQGTRATGVNRVGGERALWSSHCAHNHGNQCMCTDCEGCCKWKSAKGCGDRLWQGLLWLGGQGILWRMTQVVRPRGCREQQPEGTAWVQLLASNTPTCRNHLCLFHYNKTWHLVALCGYVFSWRGCRLHHYSNF